MFWQTLRFKQLLSVLSALVVNFSWYFLVYSPPQFKANSWQIIM
jgi:hypothetical protein